MWFRDTFPCPVLFCLKGALSAESAAEERFKVMDGRVYLEG
ncbi:hypothetical protein [Infirmifilum sp. NZ]|nr:hypothetical protein [Infirmifilum sp. NZ]